MMTFPRYGKVKTIPKNQPVLLGPLGVKWVVVKCWLVLVTGNGIG